MLDQTRLTDGAVAYEAKGRAQRPPATSYEHETGANLMLVEVVRKVRHEGVAGVDPVGSQQRLALE